MEGVRRAFSPGARCSASTTSTTRSSAASSSGRGAGRICCAHRRRAHSRSGRVCVALIAGCTLLNLAPSLYSWSRHGRPIILRDKVPAESEVYGLKIRQLVSPVFAASVSAVPLVDRKGSGGAVSARDRKHDVPPRAGRHARVSRAAGPAVRSRAARARRTSGKMLLGASQLTLAAVLLATVGGFGSLFSLLVSPEIRAYNRICSVHRVLFAHRRRPRDRFALQDARSTDRRRGRRARARPG